MELEIDWVKSSESGGNDGGDCVWVGRVPPISHLGAELTIGGNCIRPDTVWVVKDDHGHVCQYTQEEWTVFIKGVLKGDFNHTLEEAK